MQVIFIYFSSTHLVCQPPSRLVNLLVENKSLYATYGKQYGQFVDNPHVDKYFFLNFIFFYFIFRNYSWHSTWQLAVTLAKAMNMTNDSDEDQESPEAIRKNSIIAKYYNIINFLLVTFLSLDIPVYSSVNPPWLLHRAIPKIRILPLHLYCLKVLYNFINRFISTVLLIYNHKLILSINFLSPLNCYFLYKEIV